MLRSTSKKALLSAGLSILLVVLFASNLQTITDWWRLWGYQPPAAISQLADQDTMTPYARHLFYLNRPELLSTVVNFRQKCPESEDTIVLGCYHPGENGIYIYQVKDATLGGVTQVTAAHENLHAIYARLSADKRRQVNGWLEDYYRHGLSDSRVKDEITLYKQKEPNAVPDEMHSIFGTEVANLPAPLENYYKQYFRHRSVVVAFSRQYEQAFTARQTRLRQYDSQLAAMKARIDAQEADLQAQQDQLNAAQSQLKALLAAGQNDQYNAQVLAYNNQIRVYNEGVAMLRQLISQYNALVKVRNGVADELTTLDKALDTRLAPSSPANY